MTFKRFMATASAAAMPFAISGAAQAATLFTSEAAFTAAVPAATTIENFEDSNPLLRDQGLPTYTGPGGEITFTGLDGTPVPNVWLATPPYPNFGLGVSPTTSIILTANGNEGFLATLSAPRRALGFNVFLNDLPFKVTFLGTDGPLVINYDTPPVLGNNLGFAGIVSTGIVTGFQIQAINGQNINTGVDNVRAGGVVPEPATWAMMILGFGAVGASLRSARRQSENVATA